MKDLILDFNTSKSVKSNSLTFCETTGAVDIVNGKSKTLQKTLLAVALSLQLRKTASAKYFDQMSVLRA